MRTTLFALAITSFAFTACAQSENSSTTTSSESTETSAQQEEAAATVVSVGPEEFASMMESNPGILIDVRTADEYSGGHLEGAKLVDYYGSDFEANINELDRDVPVYVYCRSGGRSGRSASQMEEMGFKTVIDLSGGIMAWESAGKETIK